MCSGGKYAVVVLVLCAVTQNPASSDHNSFSLKPDWRDTQIQQPCNGRGKGRVRQKTGIIDSIFLQSKGRDVPYLRMQIFGANSHREGCQEACLGIYIDEMIRTGDAHLIGTREQAKDRLSHSEPSSICWRCDHCFLNPF
ncbi:hypothetical protein IW262DRAFT_981020 [Armillaria fumosa]|nr:hypothetical protein IW262DRAFT_981020 [Armillaria fumosa]